MGYKNILPKVLGLALLCLAIGVRADNNDAFEDCATTTFEMRNNKVYVGADVIKFVKLQVGQGSIDCMSLCRASDECWSYNYDKTRKFCYLSSDEGTFLKGKRRQNWNSGYRVCVAHSDNTEWNNNEIDASTLAATWGDIDVQYADYNVVKKRKLNDIFTTYYPWTDGTITFSWEAAKGLADLNGAALPQYRIRCGPNNTDWHCDEAATEGWNSGYGLIDETFWSTSATEDFQALFALGAMKCYIETYVDGIKTSCSDAHVDPIDPFAAPIDWQPAYHPGSSLSTRKLQQSGTHSNDNSIVAYIDNALSYSRGYMYNFMCTNDFTITTCDEMVARAYDCMYGYDIYSAETCAVTAYGYYPALQPPTTDYTLLHNYAWGPPAGIHRCFLGLYADFFYGFGGPYTPPICQTGEGTLVTVSGNSSWVDWYDLTGPFKTPTVPSKFQKFKLPTFRKP